MKKFTVNGDPGGEYTEKDADEVWMAIALHTSPGIAERRGILVRAVREGVRVDVGTTQRTSHTASREAESESERKRVALATMKDQIEAEFPRLDIEIALADAVVDQALDRPEKAPMPSWPGVLLAARLAGAKSREPNPAF